MKQSKILKALSYIILPMLIAIVIISSIYIVIKNQKYYNEEQYYSSSSFVSSYMAATNYVFDKLIHYNNQTTIKDGETDIIYEQVIGYQYYFNAQQRYYLAIYKNKALTNVELTTQTNTIEGIKEFINKNENSTKVSIINGEIQSQSEVIQELGKNYLDGKITYYTNNELIIEESSSISENSHQYITTSLNDFEFYGSFVEKFDENSEAAIIKNFINAFPELEQNVYVIIPITTILIVLIAIYLIISIGHKKGTNEISINDLDKIPLEIIAFVAICIGCIPFIILEGVTDDYNAIASLLVTAYLLIYVLCAITFHTLIKRVKSKTLLKSTIIGRIILFVDKIIIKLNKKIKSTWQTFTYSTNITAKVILYSGLIAVIGLVILLMFRISFMTILLETILILIVLYKIIKAIKNFIQVENKLKEIYEGNNQNKLKSYEFIPEFQNTVKYINDISNGLDNAIQEKIKSERLKAELITNVSHDVKTPLTSIINYVDLLKKENIENEKAKEYIEILDNKSQRLKKLTEDLVEASKVSTGNISLKLEKINIVELLKQASGEFEDKFQKRGLKTIIDCKETEINIMADSRYMYRIIENLLSNISKYALENSRVYIDIKKIEKQVKIEVKNISKDKLNISAEELMQRFVRGDKSRTTEGSGLGISIAQNLTELQKGKFNLILDGDLFKVELVFDVI